MNQKEKMLRMIWRVLGVLLGLISVLAGIAAIGRAGEPERYWVATVVMILAGVLWVAYSVLPSYPFTKKNSLWIGIILLLGLTLSLFYTFNFCGGECGCFQYRGYPGYWLKGSTCVTSLAEPVKISQWDIDASGLLADIVFWMDAGLIYLFVWKFVHSKSLFTKRIN